MSPINNLLPVTTVNGIESLVEIALDMHWAWNHASDQIWRKLDAKLWELTQNPWVILQTVSKDKLEAMLADPIFCQDLNDCIRQKQQAETGLTWFEKQYPQTNLTKVAYFSMEFMLSEALPIYSGGLGNVAGDQLKTASDLGVPVVGIGLLYQQGYFRQLINNDSKQVAIYPYNDPGQLPIKPLRQANGEWLRLEIALPGYSIWLRTWQVQVGRAKLYLLDSNDAANLPIHRGITSELYGGDLELRLKQELILGIGGWQLLTALGIHPEVCHLNEGHAAFAVLERARSFMQTSGQSFAVALAVTRAGNVFTTHTAVKAGFDYFSPALIEHYLGDYATEWLGISLSELLALGRIHPSDETGYFNMAYLAIRGSGSVNGVSSLHGEVSRELFAPLFPGWPIHEVPVGHVTNGIHVPTWDSSLADDLWTKACGKDRWLKTATDLGQQIRKISDIDLWQFRAAARDDLVKYVRHRLSLQLTASGASVQEIDIAKNIFDPKVLTLGFARRFVTYKRSNLLLSDPARLERILTNSAQPVQLIIAGKAHPADKDGQALIHEWIKFIRRPKMRAHIIFLSDYDLLLAERLMQGVDVWINTPRRPWEASGTSGMKVLVNGGLNLSELDGWWAEAYAPDVGWAIGDGINHHNDPKIDAIEAEELYNILEQKVIPEFYARNQDDMPDAWIKRVRESMARLTPQFSTNRTIQEYAKQYYLPAATAYQGRSSNQGAIGRDIINWQEILTKQWHTLYFNEVHIETSNNQHVFKVQIHLNSLDPKMIQVELYADGIMGSAPIKQKMHCEGLAVNQTGNYIYSATVPASRSKDDYTARIIPYYDSAIVPLEMNAILWQR